MAFPLLVLYGVCLEEIIEKKKQWYGEGRSLAYGVLFPCLVLRGVFVKEGSLAYDLLLSCLALRERRKGE